MKKQGCPAFDYQRDVNMHGMYVVFTLFIGGADLGQFSNGLTWDQTHLPLGQNVLLPGTQCLFKTPSSLVARIPLF